MNFLVFGLRPDNAKFKISKQVKNELCYHPFTCMDIFHLATRFQKLQALYQIFKSAFERRPCGEFEV